MSEPRGMSDIKQVAERLKIKVAEAQRRQAEARGANGASQPAPERPRPVTVCAPDCPRCAGVGWMAANVSYGHPDFGRLFPCPNLPARTKMRSKDTRTGLKLHEMDSLNWGVIIDHANSLKAMRLVQDVLARGYGLVYLWGDVGTAKSLILKIAVAEAVRAGGLAAFALAADILDEIREAYNQDDPRESAASRLERWSELPLLCIDELGRTANTEWAGEKLFQLLNRRHEGAIWQETTTLISSNFDPEKLDRALYDRMRDGRHLIIHMEGDSARPLMRQEDRF
jgi:DNA replication protein DnaC